MAFVMTIGDVLNPTRAIYVSNTDGSGRVELTTPSTDVLQFPKWSPDEKRIAYAYRDRRDSTQSNVTYVVEISRPGFSKRLGTGNPNVWLDDDRVVTSSFESTRILSVTAGTEERIFTDSTTGFPVRGGTHFFYRDFHAGHEGRWIVRIDDKFNPIGPPRKLMDTPPLATSRSRDYVLYVDDEGLWKVMLPSGQKQKIRNTFVGLTPQSNFSLNEATQEIVYTVNRSRAKLVMMENPFK
jgi:hypothetical protein